MRYTMWRASLRSILFFVGTLVVFRLFHTVSQLSIGLSDTAEGYDPLRVTQGQRFFLNGKGLLQKFQLPVIVTQFTPSQADIIVAGS